MKPKPTPTPRQTSDRVSKLAGRILRMLEELPSRYSVSVLGGYGTLRIGDVRALAASCLAQDQVRGPRSPKKRKAKGRK